MTENNYQTEDYSAEYRDLNKIESGIKNHSFAKFGMTPWGTPEEIEIPKHLQSHRWLSALVELVNTTNFPESQRYVEARTFESILGVFEEDPNPNMSQFGLLHLKYLKQHYDSENRIYECSTGARKLFLMLTESDNHSVSKRQLHITAGSNRKRDKSGMGNWPKLKPPSSDERKTLEQIAPAHENAVYFDALKRFASAYLNKWHNIKACLKNEHPSLYTKITEFIETHGEEYILHLETRANRTGAQKVFKGDDWLIYEQIHLLGLEIIETINDDFLSLHAITYHVNSKHFHFAFGDILESDNLAEAYVNCFRNKNGNGMKEYCFTLEKGKERKIVPNLVFSLFDFLRPTTEERLCVTWLLATARLQPKNIETLLLENVELVRNVIFIKSYKGRWSKTGPSGIPKNSLEGRALYQYLSDRKEASEYIASNKFVQPLNPTAFQLRKTSGFWFLRIQETFPRCNLGIKIDHLEVIRALFVPILLNKSKYGIGASYVAQTHVAIDEAKRGQNVKVSNNMQFTYDVENPLELELKAEREFHAKETREIVYRSRSRDMVQLKTGERFAVRVSEEMHKMVDDIIDRKMSQSELLDFKGYQDAIGLSGIDETASPETLMLAAKAQDYVVELNGLVKKGSLVYIFDNGLTARLLMEAIAHIESDRGRALEDIFMRQGKERGINIWAEYIYLDTLLNRLSKSSIRSAKTDYAHLEGKIPHKPLNEGGIL